MANLDDLLVRSNSEDPGLLALGLLPALLLYLRSGIDPRAPDKSEGRLEGKQEGRAELLMRQLAHRLECDALPDWARDRIRNADPAELDKWGLRLLDLDARNLEDVLH